MHALWLKVGAAAALTLSGCIETVTKADGSTQVTMGPGVARKQMRDRDVQRTREQRPLPMPTPRTTRRHAKPQPAPTLMARTGRRCSNWSSKAAA